MDQDEEQAFAAEAHRQSLAVSQSPHAKEDQDFIDAVNADLWEQGSPDAERLVDAERPPLPGYAHRASFLGADTAFDLLAEVNRLRSQGRDVISFGIGEPDMPTPAHVVGAGKAALDAGLTRYGPTEGLPELRQAIAEHVASTRGIDVTPEQVLVAPGAKPFIF